MYDRHYELNTPLILSDNEVHEVSDENINYEEYRINTPFIIANIICVVVIILHLTNLIYSEDIVFQTTNMIVILLLLFLLMLLQFI